MVDMQVFCSKMDVEHPVTEWIAEINLPAAQVAVGMGIPLWKIPEIRRFYGMEHGGGNDAWRKTSVLGTPFDFDKAQSTKPKGHCVAVRVTSEDSDDGFKPTGGKVQELSFKSKPNVWAYFSVKSGGGIHEFSDSQFGHVFAFGESRALAISNMVLGLKEIQIRGEIRTNVDYTIDLLNASDYRDNKIHTGWLDSRIAMHVRAERPMWYLSVVGAALYNASASSAALISDYVGYLEKGQIPPKHISLVRSQVSLNIEGSKYMLDGNSHVIYAEEEAAGTRLLIDGRTCFLQNDHDPSKLIAETPCKLLRYLVVDDSHIDADTPYAEIEVMKMCMPLLSPASGIIHFKKAEGQAMQAGELIAKLDLGDPSAVRKAEPFNGSFPILGPPTAISGKVHQKCAASLNAARMILAGYEQNIDEVVQSLLNCLENPELPFLQWQKILAVMATRLPKDLRNELEAKYKEFESISSSQIIDFPAKLLMGILEAHLSSCLEKEKGALERLIEPLMSLVKSYEGGRESHAHKIVQSLFEEYLSVEELFGDNIQGDVIERLRLQSKKDLFKIVDVVLSHQGVKRKNKLILRLMDKLVYLDPAAYSDQLIRFSKLNHIVYSELVLKASQMLEQTKLSELGSSIARSLSELEFFTEDGENTDTPKRKSYINDRMEDLVSSPLAVEDALVGLFDHSDHALKRRAVETYIRRLYQQYLVKGSLRMQWHKSGLITTWEFIEENFEQKKLGVMVVIKSLQFLPAITSVAFREATKNFHDAFKSGSGDSSNHGNVMHIGLVGINNQTSLLQDSGDEDQDKKRIDMLIKVLREQEVGTIIHAAGVGDISCIIHKDEGFAPMRYSFHWSAEKLYYEEEPLLRHLEPPLSIYLELDKLKGYENIRYTPSQDHQWHLYTVVDTKPLPIQRMFLRTLLKQPIRNEGHSSYQRLDGETSRTQLAMSFTSRSILRSLMGAMEELELNSHNTTIKSEHAHMYLYIIRKQQVDDLVPNSKKINIEVGQEETTVEAILEDLAREIHSSVGVRMHRLGVFVWEVKLWITAYGQANGAWRVIVNNVTGHTCTVHIYREMEDATARKVVYSSVNVKGPLHGASVNKNYQPLRAIDRKRLAARKNSTTYCYDFPLSNRLSDEKCFLQAFQTSLEQSWSIQQTRIQISKGKDLLKVTELKFSEKEGICGTPLVPVERPPGLNDVGMVAWLMDMYTPEFPSGRTILVVSNDVTFKAGSFGPGEDAYFRAVTDLACAKKIPLIYLAASSGARLGVAEEVKACFRVGWFEESNPEHGFRYVYLTPEDYVRIRSSVMAHELKIESGETRWVIDTILGKDVGLGVENLSGSGAIAGAYSRAYKETFTLTYVTGTTVGIGAYLARLGMRCIQRFDQPMILTGFSALNKLLGREVYSSHMQLGGSKIMATNGVVHLTVSDDLEGVSSILKWLSYIPSHVGGALPVVNPLDSPEREVEYLPENSCDPRAAISGILDVNGKWLGGIFDKDSFVETLEGWARTVVTGRAKLGGIPVGIVAVETQTVMQIIPADPCQLDSHERVVPQAGQVWFPDSATKTAQAILDFNREELPLFILANWRGFSGGQRDLFEGILQAGSTIVENLRTYKQPIFVYIPMMGELRGGAWVVADSRINSGHIETYAERTAKGNALEPEGMIEIKFRTGEMLECMRRLDQQLITLKEKLSEAKSNKDFGTYDSLQQQIRFREKQLLPLYTQIAIKFVELHDTSLKMAAIGAMKEVIDWRDSRSFFYRRLHRRIGEHSLINIVRDAAGDQLTHVSAMNLLKEWYMNSDISKGSEDAWLDDEAFFRWRNDPSNYEDKLKELRIQRLLLQLKNIGDSDLDLQALSQGLATLLSKVNKHLLLSTPSAPNYIKDLHFIICFIMF
ncbi:putative ligase [Medicago truncatula]|uniref:Putative ligase n=1 Tax=Medicago truncatula TaxID=3880 RepID=A0A396IVC2_MEDTR|nr:putative ligase [Medicago truncatula]